MHVGRDERLPVALFQEEQPAIVSPAYFMFEVLDSGILDEEYLMLWFRRAEFDRKCWFHTDGSVRGGLTWDDFCRILVRVPDLEEQKKIVHAYKVIEDRINLKKKNNCDMDGIKVSEIAFTTLTHADLCHALIKIIGNVRAFEIGDRVTVGPTPVNKLLIKGEVFGKDEINSALLISTSEMTSLPKKPVRDYMSMPLISLEPDMTIAYAMKTLLQKKIHGAPVLENGKLAGIVTLTDIVTSIDRGMTGENLVREMMVKDVITIPSDKRLYEVVRQFKERDVGRVIVMDGEKPVGILTHSDILRVFPAL
jgi:predicted transcriptional regulator